MAGRMEKQIADELKYTCCICDKKAEGFGNNPQPIKDKGRCCDTCNAEVVIPARLKQLHKYLVLKKQENKAKNP